ncbi:MAG: hypothetical protein ACK559_36775, partial [bacterium]
ALGATRGIGVAAAVKVALRQCVGLARRLPGARVHQHHLERLRAFAAARTGGLDELHRQQRCMRDHGQQQRHREQPVHRGHRAQQRGFEQPRWREIARDGGRGDAHGRGAPPW